MKFHASMMSLAVLLGGQHYNTVNAVRLRQSTLAEDPVELAETQATAEVDQSFPWTPTHDCNWVHRRLADQDYLTYDQQVAQQITSGEKWTDPTFPTQEMIQWPDVTSGLGGTLSSFQTSSLTKFLRISSNFSAAAGFSLFGKDNAATVDDITQGSIGNCWFMAAASAIAEIPGRIEQMFGDKDQFNNDAGFFDVNLYLLSVPITIRIDDNVPTYMSTTNTVFAKIINKGVWMTVLEKAFAKMYGNYQALISGSSERAVMSMIGTPGTRLSTASMTTAQIYSVVETARITDIVTASSATTSYFGFVANHAYTVIDVYTITPIGGTATQLIKLRNPWGSDDTNQTNLYRDGDWQSWNAVTDVDKARLGYALNGNDGIQFMRLDQFKTAFQAISKNPTLDGWTRSYFLKIDDQLVNPGKNVYGGAAYTRHEFTITTDVSQDVIFQVNVHDSRLYPLIAGCGSGVGVNSVRTIVEWVLPGSSAQTYYFEGEYNLKNAQPYSLVAGTTYRINLELWGGNANIRRDFSVVAFGSKGAVNFTSLQGLTSDHWFNSGI